MSKTPSTNATRLLKAAGVVYSEHLYRYEDKGGTAHSARELSVDEHAVIKTLVFEDDQKRPFLILMHGDREVSVKELARQTGARSVQPCKPEVADKHSGYQVGGTSPFGTRKAMPVYAEATIFELDRIWINGGAKGFLVALEPAVLESLLKAVPVQVGLV
ncbi:MAG TPA: aminoacyl-tRNA deacylase [Holophagaceae bacterium]|jgi:Cys-tRNA(Pro) deacylase|nr:aminoacyl-tRNA deacylase [Holophagaceae bacterium]